MEVLQLEQYLKTTVAAPVMQIFTMEPLVNYSSHVQMLQTTNLVKTQVLHKAK